MVNIISSLKNLTHKTYVSVKIIFCNQLDCLVKRKIFKCIEKGTSLLYSNYRSNFVSFIGLSHSFLFVWNCFDHNCLFITFLCVDNLSCKQNYHPLFICRLTFLLFAYNVHQTKWSASSEVHKNRSKAVWLVWNPLLSYFK